MLIKPFAILSAVLLILFSFPFSPEREAAAQDPLSTGSKVSSRLDAQLKAKSRFLQGGGQARPDEVGLPQLTAAPQTAATQKVFLHFKAAPTAAQIGELQSLGVTAYPASWIPPVGAHPTGFIYAEMPVDRLPDLVAKDYLVSLGTAEVKTRAKNNLATLATGVNTVWSTGYKGAGVTVAVLDSGIDLTHPDIPAPVIARDYSAYPAMDNTVANLVTGHGTHVAGTVLGRGTASGGLYRGVAPQAGLVFLKIGNDSDASSSTAADVGAIKDAVDLYGAKVITMSYGAWTDSHDGTDEESQAVDYAVSRGAVFLAAAGNEGADAQHYSGTVNANSTTDWIQVNVSGASSGTALAFNLVWFDGIGVSNNLALEYYSSSQVALSPSPLVSVQAQSFKGTENVYSHYGPYVSNGAYYLKVRNNSASSQLFHIYYDYGYNTDPWYTVTFASPDPFYTIGSPAEADSAIAVGAYYTRTTWTDYKGSNHAVSATLGTAPPWSSRGPRVDLGAPGKPSLSAPGSIIVSARDRYAPDTVTGQGNDPYIIDNDGLNLGPSNTGPADYIVMQGTSMATPHAAGIAALLLSKNPSLTPAQVKAILESTATDKGSPGRDNIYGYGLVNATAALSDPDVNGDRTVDALDLAAVAASFNKRNGDAGFNIAADINNDGVVDIYDLVQVGLNFGSTR